MGSSGSKSSSSSLPAQETLSCSGRILRGRSKGRRVFQSACLGTPSGSHHSDNDDSDSESENKKNAQDYSSTNQTAQALDQMKVEGYRRVKAEESVEMPCISSNSTLNGWDQAGVAVTAPRAGSTSARVTSLQSLNTSSNFLSRFSFIPGNVSFRLSRASSLGSSRSYPVSSTNLSMLNDENEPHLSDRPTRRLDGQDETQQGRDLLPASVASETHTQCYGDSPANFRLNTQSSGLSDNLPENQSISSTHDMAGACNNFGVGSGSLSHPRTLPENESSEIRQSDRRTGSREPVERNFRFSRTLSVGRLRDRVLRRSSLSDFTFCPPQQEGDERDASHSGDDQHVWTAETRGLASEDNVMSSPTTSGFQASSLSSSLFSTQDFEVDTTRPREARYHDLLEHRSNFLERRRRIRSQVRALQRLGSRFENLSGHERSCILSGQHRTGHCTCRINNRDTNINDNTSARASISRIVMLAEALFEVLDEIHQQSVVLSSRPASSIGSLPAPNDVVDSLPVKFYSKLQKHQTEEAAQCYICLVEYEEGDSMRVLPCHHEFHATCVDKWLKEIHRVCPLCRGDICSRSDALSDDVK
ncbi:E3 ubiquitin-protein ligase MBR1-like isoform X1 [Cucumis melo var. makuwa]|uniref:E3 ubiquitin-protein ligase MBR1-like isoform X1 n=2 Tax=Cucumis melo TaxID=3656 RepID=A0A5A7TF55_CUCMM|nr:E3 ubiquitin-protein ligase MBR1-like isoform X1 [Cucumis melo var. makuwa]TYK16447.1 E3 ubiquitin-protein ligase MBR1-like isoform X1 [Cucumis melo var. makuwa]